MKEGEKDKIQGWMVKSFRYGNSLARYRETGVNRERLPHDTSTTFDAMARKEEESGKRIPLK